MFYTSHGVNDLTMHYCRYMHFMIVFFPVFLHVLLEKILTSVCVWVHRTILIWLGCKLSI